MPEFIGTALAREIRLLRPDIPVILMSGYRGAQLRARGGSGKPCASRCMQDHRGVFRARLALTGAAQSRP
jgi:hypothetical protein